MKKVITITADTNDGDYVTSNKEITDEELVLIEPVVEAIKNFKPYEVGRWKHTHNYPTGVVYRGDLGELSAEEYYTKIVTPKEFETFDELVPYNEYGIHTIESIKVLEIVKETKLL